MTNQATTGPSDTFNPQIESLLVRAHSLAAFATLLLAVTFGILVSLQFVFPDALNAFPSWGRMRYAHTQGIMLGWLGNAFFAFMYHAVPILSGRPVTSRTLGVAIFALWNFAVMIPGWILVLAGFSQPLEWAEFPLPVDVLIVIGFVLVAVQFLPGFFKHGFENLYVSSWYLIGALVFTLLSFPMGNIVPELVPGAAGAAFSGLWIHDAVGLFVTPMALAILYYVIPASTGKPIFSHFLSMLGFWGLFFLYPLNGLHHYIFSAIPMGAQLTAILASILLGVVVVIVVSNLMLSQRGAGLIPKNIALRFASMGVVFYLVVSLQGSLQASMSFSSLTHFTDFVIGHSHLAMLGFATYAGIAGIIHAWQRIPGYSLDAKMLDWSYYLLTVGIVLMVLDLSVVGMVQGEMWQQATPWVESLRASAPYWAIRSLTAIPITVGFGLLFYALVTSKEVADQQTAASNAPEEISNNSDVASSAGFSPALRMSYISVFVCGIGFFVGSVSLLGVIPLQSLEEETALLAPVASLALSPAEQRGRVIYAREGCSYCHSQQVRYTEPDMQRFGAPSLAWEGRLDTPHMLGTRRVGPDLARAHNTRTSQWHLAHLFAPREVVPLSVMPAYPELFDGAADKPTREAMDLLAYIETLGRERELAWPEGDQRALSLTDDERALSSLNSSLNTGLLNAHPARTRPRGSAPILSNPSADVSGQPLFSDNCSGCHGDQGLGDGDAAAWLQPPPVNFTEHRYNRDLLADILWNGVHGSSMPAWRDFSIAELSALAGYVDGLSEVSVAPVASSSNGQQVYATHCAECHGDNGDGNGFAAQNLPIPIMPTDFTRERLSEEAAMRALNEGIEGTSMAPWGDRLSQQEMNAATQYVRSLFQGMDAND
jgi:cbb3-type cytochrome c oxidase subunit II